MEDYYLKYAKPINPFTCDNIIYSLQEWHNNAKEELEIYLFLIKELKNDSLNKFPYNEKVKAFNGIEKFKKVCQLQMERISEFLIELQRNNNWEVVEEKIYMKLEELRKGYNNMLLINQKFIISIKFLIEMKHKYLVNKKELQSNRGMNGNNKNNKNVIMNSNKSSGVYEMMNYSIKNEETNIFNNEYMNSNQKKKRKVDTYLHKAKSPYKNLTPYNTNGNNSANNIKTSFNTNHNRYTDFNNERNSGYSDKKIIKHSRSFINLNQSNDEIIGFKNKKDKSFSNNSTIKNTANNISVNHNISSKMNMNTSFNNCLYQDKTNCNKLQQENEELKDEIKNIKSQLNVMSETIRLLSEKVKVIQKENNALKQHNQSLINLIEKGLGLNK